MDVDMYKSSTEAEPHSLFTTATKVLVGHDDETPTLTPRELILLKKEMEARKEQENYTFAPKINEYKSPKPSADARNEPVSETPESKFDRLYKSAMSKKAIQEEHNKKNSPTFTPTLHSRSSSRERAADSSTDRLYSAPGAGRARDVEKKVDPNAFSPQISRRGSAIERSGPIGHQRLYDSAKVSSEKKKELSERVHAECTFSPTLVSSERRRASSVTSKYEGTTIADRSQAYISQHKHKIESIKQEQLYRETSEATFQPALTPKAYSSTGTTIADRSQAYISQHKEKIESIKQAQLYRETSEATFQPTLTPKAYSSPAIRHERKKSILKDTETFNFSPSINENYQPTRGDCGVNIFDRLHEDDRRRKERDEQLSLDQQRRELEECTFSPTFPVNSSGPSDGKPVHQRLLEDGERQRERAIMLEAARNRSELAEATFSPALSESSRRMHAALANDKPIFERLTERRPSTYTPVTPTTPSRLGSFSDRSLSRHAQSLVNVEDPAVLKQTTLTPDEQAELYNRLNERAAKASERLRELRQNPEAGTESAISSARGSRLGSFSDRSLSRSKYDAKNRQPSNSQDDPALLKQTTLTPEEQAELYQRLNDRGTKASDRLKELKQNPDTGIESAAASARISRVGSFSDRSLSRPQSRPQSRAQSPSQSPSPPPPPEVKTEEAEGVYSRLIDRARSTADKLLAMKATVPKAGAAYGSTEAKSSTGTPLRSSSLRGSSSSIVMTDVTSNIPSTNLNQPASRIKTPATTSNAAIKKIIDSGSRLPVKSAGRATSTSAINDSPAPIINGKITSEPSKDISTAFQPEDKPGPTRIHDLRASISVSADNSIQEEIPDPANKVADSAKTTVGNTPKEKLDMIPGAVFY